MEPTYIGDSVYIRETKEGDLVIYLDNGYGEESLIFLDDSTAEALVKHVTKWLEEIDEEEKETN
jgi:hypothetical protein